MMPVAGGGAILQAAAGVKAAGPAAGAHGFLRHSPLSSPAGRVSMERRLAALMAADVVGYSRMIRSDEEGTLAALKALRADLIDPKLAEHHGRVVKLMGDGMLAEFESVVARHAI